MTVAATVRGTYVYNGFEQLISRVITNSGTANGTTYFVHDIYGNIIAELTTAGATVREYIYLPETEIAPTRVFLGASDSPPSSLPEAPKFRDRRRARPRPATKQ